MKGFIATIIAAGIALWVAARFVPGIVIPSADFAKIPEDLVAFGTVALVFGVANGLVMPIIKLVSVPITLVTTGLFGIVLNVGLFLLAAYISDQMGGGIRVGDFPPDLLTQATLVAAAIGSVLVGLVGSVTRMVIPG